MSEIEFLRETKVSGSAYAVTTARPTSIYLGICEEHERPVRFDTEQADRWGSPAASCMIPCPVTGHLIKGERLSAVTTNLECDGSCRSARRPHCSCGCGGVNHGNTWTADKLLSNGEAVESELAKYRAELHKAAEKREKRAAAKAAKQRRDFETWSSENAELVQWLAAIDRAEETTGFLYDMIGKVQRGEILSDNMLAVVVRIRDERTRKAERETERKAMARPAPVGKGVRLSGQIVKVTCREGYMSGSVEMKAVVQCDGYAIWVTVPRDVERWAFDNRRKMLTDGWKPSYQTDYHGASARWTNALKGVQVEFTANVERSDRDESFGFAKRPSRVEFTIPQPENEMEAS